jgi:hypothetical protein
MVPPSHAPRQLPLETQALFSELGFHKLLVSDERPVMEQAKAEKDVAQAVEVLNHLLTIRPGDLERAFDHLKAKGLHQRVGRKIRSRLADQPGLMSFIDQLSR